LEGREVVSNKPSAYIKASQQQKIKSSILAVEEITNGSNVTAFQGFSFSSNNYWQSFTAFVY